MYLDLIDGISISDKTHFLKNKRFDVYWEGLVFVGGLAAGKDSITSFIEKLENSTLDHATYCLSGSFVCFLLDKDADTWHCFSDGSRLKPLYYTQKAISSSFLELAKRSNLKGSDMDSFCIVEFILTGYHFSSNIFFKQIKVLNADEILEAKPGFSVVLKKRDGGYPLEGDLPADPVNAFLNILEKTALSLRNSGLRISFDLTGGLDTRLLAATFDYFGLEFDTAITGVPNNPDILIARKTAKVLGKSHPFYPVFHEVSAETLWAELDPIVKEVDGMNDIVEPYHRLSQLAESRRERGIELTIGGGGGQLYKDGIQWIKAFLTPGRERGKTRLLDKLVSTGLASGGLSKEITHNIFPKHLQAISFDYRTYLYNYLKDRFLLTSSSKYKLADIIFYLYSLRAPRTALINQYSPFLNPESVFIGINLNKRDRFRHQFHRRVISRVNPRLANLTTNRIGMSMARGGIGVVKDFFGMVRWCMSNKVLPLSNQQLYPCLRTLPETDKALSGLKDYGFLSTDTTLETIEDAYLGRFITLFKVLQILE
jgi:hypothetical protein